MAANQRAPTLLWALFGFDGRVNREVFWLGNFGIAFAAMAILLPGLDPDTGQLAITPVSPFVFAIYLWAELALAAKRLHDRSLTGWLVFLFAVPIVNIIAFFAIGLMPGDSGPNAHGKSTNQRGPV
ncbi:MAG: DUF805 domain-containing protein [Pseudomonadota bacterium]